MVQSKRLQNNKISSKIHTKGTMSKINNTINRKTTIKNKFQNGVTIESELDEGTTATIIIPKLEETAEINSDESNKTKL